MKKVKYFSFDSDPDLAALHEKNVKWDEAFSKLMRYQNDGIGLEKSKDYDVAILSYEKAVKFGERSPLLHINDYLYSIERLAVLYRRFKNYADECAVLRLGLSHRSDPNVYDKYFERLAVRLEKAEALLRKTKTTD